MASQEKIEKYQEIERRGLLDKLPKEKRAAWEELKRRRPEIALGGRKEEGAQQAQGQSPSEDKSFLENMPAYGQLQALGRSLDDQIEGYRKALSGKNPVEDFKSALGELPGGAAAEAGLTMGTGLAGQAAGGLAGLGTTVAGGPEQGAETVENVSSALTYQPQSEGGQEIVGDVAEVGQTVKQTMEAGGEQLGRAFGVDPNTPAGQAFRTAGGALPEAVGTVAGARAPMLRAKPGRPKATREAIEDDAQRQLEQDAGDTAESQPVAEQGGQSRLEQDADTAPEQSAAAEPEQPGTEGGTSPERPLPRPEQSPEARAQDGDDFGTQEQKQRFREATNKPKRRQQIREGDKDTAEFEIGPDGKIRKVPEAQEALKQGFQRKTVETVKSADPSDKAAMQRMLTIAERSLKNADYAARNRPSNVIGDSVMKRWKVVANENRKAGSDINKAAKEDLAGKRVDVSDPVEGFYDDLEEMGVQRTDDGELDFSDARIAGGQTRQAIREVHKTLKKQKDGQQLHKDRKFIDKLIDFENTPDKQLDPDAANTLRSLRRGIADRLKAESDKYADANQRFAETRQAMDRLDDVLGSRFDPQKENVDAQVGTRLRSVLSNNQNQSDMIQAVDQLDEVANKYGGELKGDPVKQVVFFSELENRFGSFAPNSIQGNMEKAAGQAGLNQAGNAAVMGDKVGASVGVVRGALDKARSIGKSEEDAIKAMRSLLRRSKSGGQQ